MPNFTKHLTAGAAVGGGVNLLWQILKIYDSPTPPRDFWEALSLIDFGKVAAYAAVGAAVASIPDMLEPASHPNHRALFHSLTVGGAVTYGAFGKHSKAWSEEDRHVAHVAALSYLSHLFLDAHTPKGLPLVC
jgi:membrane-bound metal-dependent hydrolase YbcI (DUF457 family)